MLSKIFRQSVKSQHAPRKPRISAQSPAKKPLEFQINFIQPDIECKLSPAEVAKYNIHFNAYKVSSMLFTGVQLWFGFALFNDLNEYNALRTLGLLSAADNIIFGSLGPFWNKKILTATSPLEQLRIDESTLKTSSLILPYVAPALIQFGFASSYVSGCVLYLVKYSQ